MYSDLTQKEIKGVRHLLRLGFSPDFIAHTIIIGREVGLYNAIKEQVDTIKKGEEEDEE
jgi:hypothetical protein